jgi:uncharacterized membrane protein
MCAILISSNPLILAFEFEHQLIPEAGYAVSTERVYFKLRFSIFGKMMGLFILKRLIWFWLRRYHQALKKRTVEKVQ